MTVIFQGHIESVDMGAAGGVRVNIVPERSAVYQPQITLLIPKSQAAHWLVGSQVSFTVYALPDKGLTS